MFTHGKYKLVNSSKISVGVYGKHGSMDFPQLCLYPIAPFGVFAGTNQGFSKAVTLAENADKRMQNVLARQKKRYGDFGNGWYWQNELMVLIVAGELKEQYDWHEDIWEAVPNSEKIIFGVGGEWQ